MTTGPRQAAVLCLLIAAAGCEGAANGLLLGGNEPEETAASQEICPTADAPAEGLAVLFAAWDDTGDGLLSYNEFNDCIDARARAADLFAILDDDADRMIDADEFADLDPSSLR